MSIFSISVPLANAIYDVANLVLIVGAAFVFLGTIVVVWTGGIKERAAELRISTNETETARAKENAESFHAEAEQARLATEHLKQELAWRVLTHTQIDAIAGALSGLRFTVVVEHTADPEAAIYAAAVETALRQTGLDVHESKYIDPSPFFGLVVSGKNDEAEALLRAFASAKIAASRGAKHGETIVLIGSKQPFFGNGDFSPEK